MFSISILPQRGLQVYLAGGGESSEVIMIPVRKLSLIIGTLFSITFAQAEEPIGFFSPTSAHPVSDAILKDFLPSPDLQDVLGTLGGIDYDLNGDEKKEFIRVYGPGLCGNGGCPYEIYDGANKKSVGTLFGSPVYVFLQKINDWPVLTVYSHSSAASGSYSTYVFDGKKYIRSSSVDLYDKAVDELFQKFKAVKEIK
jgi:hypothetical protein